MLFRSKTFVDDHGKGCFRNFINEVCADVKKVFKGNGQNRDGSIDAVKDDDKFHYPSNQSGMQRLRCPNLENQIYQK